MHSIALHIISSTGGQTFRVWGYEKGKSGEFSQNDPRLEYMLRGWRPEVPFSVLLEDLGLFRAKYRNFEPAELPLYVNIYDFKKNHFW